MKYTIKLDSNNTKLGLPQEIETLDEIEYMEFDTDNYAELGMILDNMDFEESYENLIREVRYTKVSVWCWN